MKNINENNKQEEDSVTIIDKSEETNLLEKDQNETLNKSKLSIEKKSRSDVMF